MKITVLSMSGMEYEFYSDATDYRYSEDGRILHVFWDGGNTDFPVINIQRVEVVTK